VWGWSSGATLGLLAASAVLFTVWGSYELRVHTPLVDLRVSARPAVLLTNIASVMTGFAMFAAFMVSSQMLQAPPGTGYGFGMSLVLSGVLLLPVGLAMTVFSPVSARISRLRGPRVTLMAGAGVLVIGNLARAFLHGDVVQVVLGVTVIAVGAALALSALPTLIMKAVPAGETAAANSLNTLARTIGTSGCSAVVAAVTAGYTVEIGGRIHPSLTAYSVTFVLAACAALAAVLLAAVIPQPRPVARAAAAPRVAAVAGLSR
jgi:MFS family permease